MMLRPQHRLFERIALILQVRQPAPQDEKSNISATLSRSSTVPSRPSSAALHEHIASVTTKAASSPATGLSSLRNNIPDTIAETSSVNSLSSADKLLQGPRGTEMNEVSPAEGNENDFGIENMGTGLGTKANEMSKIWKQFRGRPNRNQLERFWAQFVPWDELQAAAMR